MKFQVSNSKYQINTNLQKTIRNWKLEIGNLSSVRGFSLVELVVVVGIMTTFLGLIVVNLAAQQRRVNISTSVESLIADLRIQQMKAMVGDTEGRATPDNYGVYFDTDSYILFHGASYSASEATNQEIPLDPSLSFSTAGQTILFTRFTGEVSGYAASQSAIVIQDVTNSITRTITFNEYGVPITLTK